MKQGLLKKMENNQELMSSYDADFEALHETQQLIRLLEEEEYNYRYNVIERRFPDTGPFRRELYPKHLEFFGSGVTHQQRAMIAGNRVGKTEAALCEIYWHMSGLYPHWWNGYRYTGPIKVWLCGDTKETLKIGLQAKFLGEPGSLGTGIVPLSQIHGKPTTKPGMPEGVGVVRIPHVTGGFSSATFKASAEGRESFQGTEVHIILFDEEPPNDVFSEALIRTMRVDEGLSRGMVMFTFTPLRGMSNVVLRFMKDGKFPTKEQMITNYLVRVEWDDVPHLSEAEKARMLSELEPWEVEARTKGIPSMGKGLIYPILDRDIMYPASFKIPEDWPRFYGLDYAYTRTAAVFFAIEPGTGRLYLYDYYDRERVPPDVNAFGIKEKAGDWMVGASETAGLMNKQTEQGQVMIKTIEFYQGLGLNLIPVDKSKGSWRLGIDTVYQHLVSGNLKIKENLTKIFTEKNTYHVDEDGKETNIAHDLMDAIRYGVMFGIPWATVNPRTIEEAEEELEKHANTNRNPICGY